MSSTNHPPEVVDTKEMEALVDKYTKDFPVHHATASSRLPGDVLLLTGSTGHFGSAILEQLVLRNHVRKIYAFNRPDKRGKTIRQRHLDAFIDHGQDVTLLDSPKISWVMGDTSQSDLGITKEVYSEVSLPLNLLYKTPNSVRKHRCATLLRMLFITPGKCTSTLLFPRMNLSYEVYATLSIWRCFHRINRRLVCYLRAPAECLWVGYFYLNTH
jgi:hypothetical protein